MPTISELKKILVPATHTSRLFPDNIYMWAALYVTWALIKLRFNANQVTYLSGIFCLIGGVFLAMKPLWSLAIGVTCIIMFHVLDCCDGYVARYNKESSLFGRFLDWYMHFVRDASIFAGLAIGAYLVSNSLIVLIFGFIAVLTPIMQKTILNCGWTAICWERLVVMKKGRDIAENLVSLKSSERPGTGINEINSVKKINFKSTFFLIITSPFSFYVPIILIILVVLQTITTFIFNLNFDFRPTLIFYTAIIGTLYTLQTLRKREKAQSFEKGYERLFIDSKEEERIELPRDYFFY